MMIQKRNMIRSNASINMWHTKEIMRNKENEMKIHKMRGICVGMLNYFNTNYNNTKLDNKVQKDKRQKEITQ